MEMKQHKIKPEHAPLFKCPDCGRKMSFIMRYKHIVLFDDEITLNYYECPKCGLQVRISR